MHNFLFFQLSDGNEHPDLHCLWSYLRLICLLEVSVDRLVSELDSKKYKGIITLN